MPLTALKPSQIRKIAANSLVGNATGAEARGTSLSVSQVRTLLGLGTTDSPTFNTVTATTSVLTPLLNNTNAAALTLGNSTYGVTVPGAATFSGTVTATSPAQFTSGFIARGAAIDLSWGGGIDFAANNGTVYGSIRSSNVSPGLLQTGTTFSGDISMSKTSAQGYIRAYATDGVKNAALYHSGSDAFLVSSSGAVLLNAASGSVGCYGAVNQSFSVYATSGDYIRISQNGTSGGILSTTSGGMNVNTVTGITNIVGTSAAGFLRVYDSAVSKYTQLTHDGTYGTLSTSANNIKLLPASGAVEIWGTDGVSTGKLRVYNSLNTQCITIAGGTAEHVLSTTAGAIVMQPATANTICYLPGTNSTFRVYDSSATKYSELTHDPTNGILSTSSGNLNLVPAGGTVAVTGGITASGGATITGGGLASTYGVKIGSHSVGVGGIWSDSVTPSATNYNLLVEQTWTLINAPNVAGAIYFMHAGNSTATMTSTLFTCPPINTGAINCQGINVAYGGSGGTISTTTVPLILSSATSIIGLGGVTSSFPAIKRSSTTAAFRLGDDSADAPISCAGITASGDVISASGKHGGLYYLTGYSFHTRNATYASAYRCEVAGYGQSESFDTSSGTLTIYDLGLGTAGNTYPSLNTIYTLTRAGNATFTGSVAANGGMSTTTLTASSSVSARYNATPAFAMGALNAAGTYYRNMYNRLDLGTTVSSSTAVYGWASLADMPYYQDNDTGLSRDSAGVVEINNGARIAAGGSYGALKCAGITASGNVSFTGGLSTGTVTKVAHYTTTADDYRVNVTANSVDITFETAVGCANREHEVVNSGSGVVTLKTTSAQTISGNASGALTLAQWKSIRVVSDGANWIIMSQIT